MPFGIDVDLDAVPVWVWLVILIVGLLLCFFGELIWEFMISILGFMIGWAIGFAIGYAYLGILCGFGLAIIMGMIFSMLFQFLAKQENMHYVFLQKTYDYLTTEGAWYFDEQEFPMFDGA